MPARSTCGRCHELRMMLRWAGRRFRWQQTGKLRQEDEQEQFPMEAAEVIWRFYESLAQKTAVWQQDLAEDVVFADASKKLYAEGRAAFIQSFTSFLRSVERVQLRQLIVDGANAAAVVSYDYVSPSGGQLHQDDAEVWKIVDGRIAALTIFFDITEFRTFMAR
jgi:ketosteroid isomerase-like protein